MKLPAPLVHLFDHPVDALRAALPGEQDAIWEHFAQRRHIPEHRATRTIAEAWIEGWNGTGEPEIWRLDYAPAPLRAAMRACADRLLDHFGGGAVTRLMLVDLRPGGAIARHRDLAPGLTLAHRCHLPVETSADVAFVIDDVDHRLEPGRCYEFDNTRPHSVANRGPTRRVHLICDVLPPAAQRGG